MTAAGNDPSGSRTESGLGAPVDDLAVAEALDRSDIAQGSMTKAVVGGASWSAVGRFATQGLQFFAGLALARILHPEDFGLLAGVYVVTGFTVLFFDMGLGAALVHQRELRQDDMDTVFWLNALGGVAFVGLLALAGPFVADFYGDPRLTYITPLAGLSFTFGIGICNYALLQRRLEFKRVAVVDTVGAVVGNAVTVVCAATGMGPIALITGPAVQAAIGSVLGMIASPWRPRGFVRRESFRRLWGFSSGMLGSSLVNFAGRNSDNLVIGRYLGAADLGFYNRAYNLMLMPIGQISQVVGRVMFPALASMGDDKPRLQRAYRRTLRMMTAVVMPLLVGMAAVADGLVPLLWGHQWDAAVPLLQILCLAGLPQCLSSSEGWLFQSQGRTRLMFVMTVISTVLVIASALIGLHWGAIGVTLGLLITVWLYQPIALAVPCSLIGLKGSRVIADIVPTVLITLVMGASVWSLPLLVGVPRDAPLLVVGQVVFGAVVYVGLMALLRRDILREMADVVPDRFKRRTA